MKINATLLSLSLALSAAVAQAQHDGHCGSSEARRRLLAREPHLAEQKAAYEHGLQEYLEMRRGLRAADDDVVYHIPLVFHILHDPENDPNDNDNISDAQILDEVNILNRDYRKLNADLSEATNGFGDIAADCRIQFQLATKDPYGNCTNGIDRITTLRTNEAADWSKLGSWFRERYINVWVVRSIGDAGVAGNAYLPPDVQQGTGSLRDGILILSHYIGSTGTSNENNSRSLTHEVGHFLNLQHVWGETDTPGILCGDDGVEDTPVTKGYDLFCPQPQNSDICVDGVFENYQNYMDYSYCSVMFTEGQKERMRAALNDVASGRNNLWVESNHQFTGINGYEVTCGPEADFYSLEQFVCANTPMHFKDNTRRATPTSWSWTFEGGTPSTSNEQDPVVSFAEPGPHMVTLIVANEHGTSERIRYDQAYIAPDWSEQPGLLAESFPTQEATHKWPMVNYEDNLSQWSWSGTVGHDAPGCLWLNASQTYTMVVDDLANEEDGSLIDKDVVLTPGMDLSNVSGMQLSFWYAYATRTADPEQVLEALKIYSSTDCGDTWLPRKTIDGIELVTGGVSAGGYVPSASDWRQVFVTIPSTLQREHVRFKFEFNSAPFCNDLYLDDINLSGTVGIAELAQSGHLDLMPNPVTDQLTIGLDMAGADNGSLSILDATGRTAYIQAVQPGQQRMDLDLHALHLTAGVYLVRLTHAKGQVTERLVVR